MIYSYEKLIFLMNKKKLTKLCSTGQKIILLITFNSNITNGFA